MKLSPIRSSAYSAKRKELKRQESDLEKSIVSSHVYPYDRIITLKSEYPPGAQPKEAIPVVLASKESLTRPHDLLLMVPQDKGNNRFSIGNSICLGTFPDRKSALKKKRQLQKEFSGELSVRSPIQRQALGRSAWNVEEEMIVRPASLNIEDRKQIKTGKVTSQKNCECKFRK